MFKQIEKIKNVHIKGLLYVFCIAISGTGLSYSLDGMSSYSDVLVWTGFVGLWLSGYFGYKTIKSIITSINN